MFHSVDCPPTERQSLRGVTRGTTSTQDTPVGCWLFGHSVPAWAAALPGLGLQAYALFLDNDDELDAAYCAIKAGGGICRISNDGDWGDEASLIASLQETWHYQAAEWALCDGRPSRLCLRLCEALGVHKILSLAPLRSTSGTAGSSWHTHHLEVHHCEVGGITEASTKVHFSWLSTALAPYGPLPAPTDIPLAVGRDASTVVLTTERTRSLCKAPPHHAVVPLRALVHTTYKGSPVYHRGGCSLPI